MKFLGTLVITLLLSGAVISQDLEVFDLSVEHKKNPMGLETSTPRLSWKLKSSAKNILQTHYQIQVAEVNKFPATHLNWESNKVASDQSVLVPYGGDKLTPGNRYYWRVRVWDNQGNVSGWSTPAYWETGLFEDDWKAQWIEPVQEEGANAPALLVRKETTIEKEIKSARAYVTAHGLYELFINGSQVGDEVFTPGWTKYQDRLQYQVYDVTNFLTRGENAIGAMLGDGWYRGHLAWEDNWGVYGKKLGLLCQIQIEYTDGSSEMILTDNTWKGTPDGPIVMNSIYNGETYDARKEISDWSKASFNDAKWKAVNVADHGYKELIPTETVPVRKIEEIKPLKIWKTPKGTLVADFGQNMVGWIRLRVSGQAGTTVTIRHAEVMDKYGEFYTDNLRAAKATLQYTLNGQGEETYEPSFTFMGFRYVAIEGFPGELKPENLIGVVIHSDMEPIGTFECSNPLINQLQKNILWGQKGNFLDVPTDCPQRDERLGWTGDAQAFVRTAAYNMDVAAFFTKWLKDVAAEQSDAGAIPFVVPNVLGSVRASAGWADVVTIAPWTMYQVYGDKELLATQYPSMKKYVDFVRKDAGRNYIWEDGSVFGDWLFFKPELSKWTVPDGHTDQDLIATAFYAYSTQLLIKAAEVLGNEADVIEFTELLENVKKAFLENYVTQTGRIISHSQTSYVLALMFDLLPEEQKNNAVNYLVNNIRSRGNHLSTGFLGTPYICHVLSENGKTDVAYDLLLQEEFPSWLYPVKMGATTIWERWDGQKPDSTFQNVSMNSFNHYAYGAIGDWMYRVVAGMEIGAPGYKHVLIQPQPSSRLDHAAATHESRYGKIVSGWKIDNGNLNIYCTIPANTTATITLPKTKINKIRENGKPIADSYPNAKEENGNVMIEVGSGSYSFTYNTSIAVKIEKDAPEQLVKLMNALAAKEKNPLMKRHFESIARFTKDTTHGFDISDEDIESASMALNFFKNGGTEWETYEDGPRPLMMSFKSPTDGKYSYYWLFVPRDFNPKKTRQLPFYIELHGSGGDRNNNPRRMLYHPLQPEIAGVTNMGYRKDGLFILPWGRGDKFYRDLAETDILEVLADFDKMYKTDPKRQYMYGFSMGGNGTFHIGQKTIDRWAAIGMYSAAFLQEPTKEEAGKFKDVPVWMAWGELERWKTNNVILKDLFEEVGVDLVWHEVEDVGHRYLGEYQEKMLDWLNSKSK